MGSIKKAVVVQTCLSQIQFPLKGMNCFHFFYFDYKALSYDVQNGNNSNCRVLEGFLYLAICGIQREVKNCVQCTFDQLLPGFGPLVPVQGGKQPDSLRRRRARRVHHRVQYLRLDLAGREAATVRRFYWYRIELVEKQCICI